MTSNAIASPSIMQDIFWARADKMNLTQSERDTARANITAVAAIQDQFDAAVSAANRNGDLSAQGRANALLAASQRAVGALDAIVKSSVGALDAQVASASRALRKAASGPDATAVTELRAIEAREAFSQVDPLMRPQLYLSHCADGTADADCIAVENASAWAPLLDDSTIEQGRALRGARNLPDQARELEVAQDLRAVLASVIATTRRHVSLGPLLPDPLQVAPLGPTDADPDLE